MKKQIVVTLAVLIVGVQFTHEAWAQGSAATPPESQAIEIDSDVEVLYEDGDRGSTLRHFVSVDGRRRELRLRSGAPALRHGDRVHLRAVPQPDGTLQLGEDGDSVQILSAAQQATLGPQSTLVLLVNFERDQKQPYTVAQAEAVMAQVSEHYYLGSYEQTSVAADVFGWLTIAYDSGSCDVNSIGRLADQAATAAGINLGAYRRRVYAFPEIRSCSFWGVGTVGGNPSLAWINGSFTRKVVGHELGHGLGLYHSKAYECGTATLAKNCSTIEYGNTLDIMGNPSSGNFNVFSKEQIGWVNAGVSPPLTSVTKSGAYWIGPYEALDGHSKGLKILKSINPATGIKTFYYAEFRQPIGNDAFLMGNGNVRSGVVISMGTEAGADLLLDMTPETGSWNDPALVAGRTFVDPDIGLEIQTVSADSGGATVMVTVPALPPSATVKLAPASPKTNDVLTATATAFDPNGDPVTLTYAWSVNGAIKKTTAATTSLTDSFDLGVSGQGDSGNVIVVEVTPFDGGLTGPTATASATVNRKKK